MPSASEWKVPASVQPKPEDYAYDLDAALSAVVGIRASSRAMPSPPRRWAPSAPATAC